jgi:hypothetical protein
LLVKIDELNTALASVDELIAKYPNDMELGKNVRKLYNNKN